MSNAELVFTILGELTTTEVARKDDAQGFDENQQAAQKGGKVAGDARQNFEETTGKPVLTSRNYLEHPEAQQMLVDDNEETPPE